MNLLEKIKEFEEAVATLVKLQDELWTHIDANPQIKGGYSQAICTDSNHIEYYNFPTAESCKRYVVAERQLTGGKLEQMQFEGEPFKEKRNEIY